MIKQNTKLEPLLDAKLLKIKIDENDLILEFDNGRTLTILNRLIMSDAKIEPQLQLICGYHN